VAGASVEDSSHLRIQRSHSGSLKGKPRQHNIRQLAKVMGEKKTVAAQIGALPAKAFDTLRPNPSWLQVF